MIHFSFTLACAHVVRSFGRNQTCAMLLALACGNSFLELGDVSTLGAISNLGPQFSDVAKQAFYDFGERPHFTERLTNGTGKWLWSRHDVLGAELRRRWCRHHIIQWPARGPCLLLCSACSANLEGEDHEARVRLPVHLDPWPSKTDRPEIEQQAYSN
jgi:hypothetical protein